MQVAYMLIIKKNCVKHLIEVNLNYLPTFCLNHV